MNLSPSAIRALVLSFMLIGWTWAVGVQIVACYDPKSPNLPPCTGQEKWPDPCAYQAEDGGSDAR